MVLQGGVGYRTTTIGGLNQSTIGYPMLSRSQRLCRRSGKQAGISYCIQRPRNALFSRRRGNIRCAVFPGLCFHLFCFLSSFLSSHYREEEKKKQNKGFFWFRNQKKLLIYHNYVVVPFPPQGRFIYDKSIAGEVGLLKNI